MKRTVLGYLFTLTVILFSFSAVYSIQFRRLKQELMEQINKGAARPCGNLWYSAGRYLYVPCALILCLVALFMKVAF